ncbi:MarR family winged helix-turn-helix transcriptional regulator [Thalassobaculum sp.]|uniref:MarR family winged helix-turn-helix transcriptional regulator n=1 Tax=Thalassobaculum sp. TaxID=2022740 RepID=UPI0032ED5A70
MKPSASPLDSLDLSDAGPIPDRDGLVLDRFLPYRLSVLANTVSRAIARLYADRFGITIPEWRVLAILGDSGPVTSAEIRDRTAMDKVQVSRAIQRLVSARLVSRRTDPADRRRATIAMTGKGNGVYREIVPLALSREAILLEGFSAEEREQLDVLLNRLGDRAGAIAGPSDDTAGGVD